MFCFIDVVSHVSAAAGALRFFACPKKVTKKMAFSFFLEKKKNKKSIQGSVLENPLALRWLSLGLVLDFGFVVFLFIFLVLCYRFCVCVLVDFSAVIAFVVLGNFPFYIYFLLMRLVQFLLPQGRYVFLLAQKK
ncbi:MAG: hypothetical protein R3Y27_07380 [Clostridia bacterium]